MVRLCRSLSLLLLSAGLVLVAAPAQATELGECAAMSSTIVRGADFLYVNAHCDDGSSAHHPKITGFEPDPGEPLPPTGWNPTFDHTNFMMDTNDVIAGRGVYRVHIVWLDSTETIPYDTAYVTVTFRVHTTSDLGVADLVHQGSTARGGTGAYTFTVTNSGQTANDVSYDVVLSPGASVPSPPDGCEITDSSSLGTRVHCVVGTLVGAFPLDASLTVVNPASGSTAEATVSAFSPWAEEPDDDGAPNAAQLAFALTGASPGTGSGPVTVQPKLKSVGKARVKGGAVKFSARVTFAIPSGQTGAVACQRKVKGSTKPAGVAKASKSKKSLSTKGGTCTAKLTFTLPKSFKGKKVKVKVAFPGNTAVKPFTKSAKLKIAG